MSDSVPPIHGTADAGHPVVPGHRIVAFLGEGGMGVVWRAIHLATGENVALKLMSDLLEGGDRDRARFAREVELARALRHPHIARVLDAGLVDGRPYYAMELVEGLPLNQHVAANRCERRTIIELMLAVCRAVGAAHTLGVIHRDLKPANVLVRPSGQPVVLDFGLAKDLHDRRSNLMTLTQEGDVAGTPRYMAPEQAMGDSPRIGKASDVYALGVMLYELVTGAHPTGAGGSNLEVMGRIIHEEPAPMPVDRLTGDEGLQAILLRCLAKSPADRYPDASALAQALEERHRNTLLRRASALWASLTQRKRIALGAAAFGLIAVSIAIATLAGGEDESNADEGQRQGAPADAPALKVSHFLEARDLTEYGRPIDLLARIDPSRDAVAGEWCMTDEGLSVQPIKAGRLQIPVATPGSYEVAITFTQVGGDSLSVHLPVGGTRCVLTLNGLPDPGTTSFSLVDGRRGGGRPTGIMRGLPHELVIRVNTFADRVRIRVYLDGDFHLGSSGAIASYSPSPETPLPRPDTLGLGASEAEVRFHQVKLTPLPSTPLLPPSTMANEAPGAGWVRARADKPINLLKEVDVNEDVLSGQARREPTGDLAAPNTSYLKVFLGAIPRGTFELSGHFTRTDDTGLVALLFPVGAGRASLEIDHPEAAYNGTALNTIGGKSWRDGPTFLPGQRLTKGRVHHLSVQVTVTGDDATVVSQLDGKPLIKWRGPHRSIDMWSNWRLPRPDGLGIAGHRAGVIWHDLTLTMLDGEAWVRDPASALTAKLAEGTTVDLLSLASPNADAVDGTWRRHGDELTAVPAGHARLSLPIAPKGSYELTGAFTHKDDSHVVILLPLISTGAQVIFNVSEGRNGKTASGIENINNANAGKVTNPATAWGKIRPGERHEFRVVVRQSADFADIEVELDNAPLTRWRGPQRELSQLSQWMIAKGRLGIGARNTAVTWHALKLRMLDGQARVRPADTPATPAAGHGLRKSILDYEAELTVHTKAADPIRWAKAQNNLGKAWHDLPTGDRDANLRKALVAHEAALTVYTKSAHPVEWAKTQDGLGNAWAKLTTGDRGENLRNAMATCEAALTVYTKSAYPVDWARTQTNLGNAWLSMPAGNAGVNLRKATAAYEAALTIYTLSAHPVEWAAIQDSMGSVFAMLPDGDREANLRGAITAYESALRVYTKSAYPLEWAMTQVNRGNAWQAMSTGDHNENRRKAIAAYEAAMTVLTRATHPSRWATIQINLGVAWKSMPTGDREENLRQAMAAFEAALSILTKSAHPVDWATTQINLGNAWQSMTTGDLGKNLAKAIEAYEAATTVFTKSAHADHWATMQNNLGKTWMSIPAGDQNDNLRKAIAAFESALTVRTKTIRPAEWAATQTDLGIALAGLAELEEGDRIALLGRAIASFKAALTVHTAESNRKNLDIARLAYEKAGGNAIRPFDQIESAP